MGTAKIESIATFEVIQGSFDRFARELDMVTRDLVSMLEAERRRVDQAVDTHRRRFEQIAQDKWKIETQLRRCREQNNNRESRNPCSHLERKYEELCSKYSLAHGAYERVKNAATQFEKSECNSRNILSKLSSHLSPEIQYARQELSKIKGKVERYNQRSEIVSNISTLGKRAADFILSADSKKSFGGHIELLGHSKPTVEGWPQGLSAEGVSKHFYLGRLQYGGLIFGNSSFGITGGGYMEVGGFDIKTNGFPDLNLISTETHLGLNWRGRHYEVFTEAGIMNGCGLSFNYEAMNLKLPFMSFGVNTQKL